MHGNAAKIVYIPFGVLLRSVKHDRHTSPTTAVADYAFPVPGTDLPGYVHFSLFAADLAVDQCEQNF
jgi:hypothetical protein